MVANNLVEELISAVKPDEEKRNTTYSAIVTRVDKDGTAWVCIAGSEKETPVSSSAAGIKRGDAVNVEWRNNKIYIAGNRSDPATGDAAALAARALAIIAESNAASAQDTADTAIDDAANAQETAEAILIYDHDYNLNLTTGEAVFTAYLYQGGVDIKHKYEEEYFTWELKTEDGTTQLGSGYTMRVNVNQCGYGAEVIGKFTTPQSADALAADDSTLTTADGDTLAVRARGDAIRVRDLSVTTTIYPTDKVMIVGAEDEHLVTMQTLQGYLNANLDKQILFGTTAEWNAQSQLQSEAGKVYVYTDHRIDSRGNRIAGIKMGDGNAYLIDLPFQDEAIYEHIEDSTIHITAAERAFWNDKVRCYYSSGDNLIFTTN